MHVKIVTNEQELHDAHEVRKKVFIEEQNVSVEEEHALVFPAMHAFIFPFTSFRFHQNFVMISFV
jgi:hypothetical protein